MKKYILLFCLLFLLCKIASAQVMPGKPLWVTFKCANLKCFECQKLLEKYLIVENKLNMESGLIQWKINLRNGQIKIQYHPQRVQPEDIQVAINNAGFDVDTALATPDSYKTLPPACKRAAEGGGPTKKYKCSEATADD